MSHVCPVCRSFCSCDEGELDSIGPAGLGTGWCIHDCEHDDEMADDVPELDFEEDHEMLDTVDDEMRGEEA